ncbi:MAG: S-methyl-5'-thioadenosine phosphorylase [Proteobacteria bacterium]|nr:S-methyl-5'-thioadenosine phosphorylase [Pseudomonadota bacterium]
MDKRVEIAIIGGSGLSEMEGIRIVDSVTMLTPFGAPSDNITIAEVGGRLVAFLPRHGRGHRIPPTQVPYAANIWALKQLGVFWVLTFSAVGSLRQEIAPEHFCVPDQIIDRTRHRRETFFDDLVVHVSFAQPFNAQLRQVLLEACRAEGVTTHDGGVYVCMEGPAFSTRAESQMYRAWGGDIIGMTAIPEAKLAMEAEMAYATVALATDYDCWHESVVTVEEVIRHMERNVSNVHRVIKRVVPLIPLGTEAQNPASEALKCALTTHASHILPKHREKYELLLAKYVDFDGSRR